MNAAVRIVEHLTSDRPALVIDEQATSAAALRTRTLAVARWMVARGVGPGDRALMLIPAGPDFAAAFLALVWIGAVPVLIDPGHPPAVWRAQLRTAAPKVAIVDRRLRWAWRVPGLVPFLRRRGRPVPPRVGREMLRLTLPPRLSGHVDPAERGPDDEALILFTSGTTSAPRGVVHTHGNVPAFLDHVGEVVADLPHATYLAETPQQIFYALLLDATCHVVRGTGEARVRATVDLLSTGRIEAWFGSPWTWVRWLERGLPVPEGLRSVLLGSAPVTRPFLRRLLEAAPSQATVRCLYGLSEAGPVCTVDAPDKVAYDGDGDLVGRPVSGVEVRITDDRGVQVRTDALAGRYLGSERDGDWLDTGDLGELTEAGLALHGRRKDMILRHAVNLYPGVLEPPLLEVMEDAALVGVYDHDREDERVVLFHVGPLPRDIDALLGVAAPDHTIEVDALPRSGRQHKVDKGSLRARARSELRIP